MRNPAVRVIVELGEWTEGTPEVSGDMESPAVVKRVGVISVERANCGLPVSPEELFTKVYEAAISEYEAKKEST